MPESLQTYQGAPGGMARSVPQHEIEDTQAWTIIDGWLGDPGLIRRRGPLTESPGTSHANSRAIGITRTQDPNGTEQILVLTSKSLSSAGEVYGISNTSAVTNYAWPYTPATSPYEIFDSKSNLQGGVWIGTAPKYDKPAQQALAFWNGASKQDVAAAAVSPAVARGDLTVTMVSGGTNYVPGHFLFNSANQLIGTVKTQSGNVLTLTTKALVAASGNITAQMLRGYNARVAKGRITTSTTSNVVNGGLTKFQAQGMNAGTWDIYTPDFTYVGTVAAVAADIQLTLVTNAAVSLLNSAFVAIKTTGSYALTTAPVGYLNCAFAGHQFFADGNTLRFSSTTDPEAVDTTANGDYLVFSQDPIRAIVAGLQDLLVITENDTFSLSGAVGTTPDRWRGTRVIDDGTVCGMSAIAYKGGVLWAGGRGIWFWDGASLTNVTDALGGDYRTFMSGMSSSTARAYGAVIKDHYLLFADGGASGVFQKIKAAVTTDITRPTFDVVLDTGAISILQNVEIRGAINLPDKLALGASLFPVTTTEAGVINTRLIQAETIFTNTGTDNYACEGGPGLGADLYVETKRYSIGDGQRLKLFRMLLLHYFANGGNIRLDTVLGLNSTGATSSSEYVNSTAYQDKRVKFMKRSQYIAFRLYQSTYSGDPISGTSVGAATISFASPAVVTANGHGLVANQEVYFTSNGVLPGGLVANQHYFVSATGLGANTFQFSLTAGGASVNTTNAGSGTHTLFSIGVANTTRITLGQWAIGFKWKRPGRV